MIRLLSLALLFFFSSATVTSTQPRNEFKEQLNQFLKSAEQPLIQDGEAVVINVWATWCGPCIKEIPELNELVEKYQDQGIRFLAFTNETTAVYEAFLKKRADFKFDYEMSFANNQAIAFINTFDKQYQGRAIPLHILVDRDGKAEAFVGASPTNTQRIEAFVKKQVKGNKK
ncbi:MAG: TlpA family protein disulfide reductase [Mongoliitalea sp.]